MGSCLTWSNCTEGESLINYKLDRALVNDKWKFSFPCSTTIFLNQALLDHALRMVNIETNFEHRKAPFKFFNM